MTADKTRVLGRRYHYDDRSKRTVVPVGGVTFAGVEFLGRETANHWAS